jgi:hypothetical protein
MATRERPSFALPGWERRTFLLLAAPLDEFGDEEEDAANIVVSEEPRVGDEALRSHVMRRLIDIAKSAAGFALDDSRETVVAERPALLTGYSWKGEAQTIHQLALDVLMPSSVVSFTCTAARPLTPGEVAELEEIAASARVT